MDRISYDNELLALRGEVTDLGWMVTAALQKALVSFGENESAQAAAVVDGDRLVNETEHAIQRRCLNLFLRQQPIAGDLRVITAAVQMIADMERIGDQAEDIAYIAFRSPHLNPYKLCSKIEKMADWVVLMVSDSVKSYTELNLELAREIMSRDDVADAMFQEIKQDLIALIGTNPDKADQIINSMMITKYLERIGDHAVNICEWVEFIKTGIHKNANMF